ncbi:MAG TPA: hypothetical protein VG603_11280, partial [Chitinophagales bacterium]|nr:hypothetical protein [Chitinophagales bacterium]
MNQRIQPWLIGALIFVAILGTYWNHFHNAFHFDDSHTIEDNAYIRDLRNIPLFFKDCTTTSSMPSHQGYRPLVTTTIAIDYALSLKATGGKDGYDTFWYHLSNFSWFLIIVFLLYFAQKAVYDWAFKDDRNKYFALLGCAWYGLHTANAETINYIISRSDILSTLSIIGSFTWYVAAPKQRKYFLYLIPVSIGCFAKETSIMFAPALVAYDYIVEKQKKLSDIFSVQGISNFLKSIVSGLPALAACIFFSGIAFVMTRKHEPGGTSPLLYALTQPYIILHYVVEFFFPVGLTADTDLPLIRGLSDDRIYIGLAFLTGLIVLAFKTSETKEWRPFSFGIIWFLLMLLPTSSFIPLAEVTNDHRVFLPYIGLIFSMVCLVANLYYFTLKDKQLIRTGMIALLLVAFGGYAYGTHVRNEVWHTEESLWKDVTEKSPDNGRGWMNYGLTQMSLDSLDKAKYAYDQALLKTPYYYILHVNYGILQQRLGHDDKAEEQFREALADGPNYLEPYYYYARYLYNKYQLPEAEIYCDKALSIFPGHIYSLYLMMDILKLEGKWQKLAQVCQQ